MKRIIVCTLALILVVLSVFGLSSCKKKKNKKEEPTTPPIGAVDGNTQTPGNGGTPEHTHTISCGEAKAKTCTEDGWNAYEYCTECDYTTKVIIPAGHVIANGTAKAKTCTEDGWNAYEYCTECDYTTKVVIPAGHVIANGTAKAKTCTEDGWNAYEYCTACDYTTKVVIPAGHVIANGTAKTKTCTEDGWNAYEYCTECDYTTKVVIPAGHVIANGTAKAKTCTEDGWNAYEYCTECDYTTKVVIPAGHTISGGEAKAKTCTEDGWNAYEYCTECDYTTKVVIPAGHVIANGTAKTKTCTEDGWNAYEYCTECDYTTKQIQTATGHSIVTDARVEPTSQSTGLTEGKHCETCGVVTLTQKTLYYFNVSIKNSAYGSISSYTRSHQAKDTIVITATADNKRSFCAWYVIKYNSNGTQYYEKITDSATLEYVMPTEAVELLAVFSEHENTDIWMGDMATEFSGGTGTSSDPFIIKSGAELNLLRYRVNNRLQYGSKYYQLLYYRLERSIDLSEHEWTPIGSEVSVNNNPGSFKGTFDGNGNVIYGLRMTGSTNLSHIGLFGYCESTTSKSVEVKNLTFEGVTINVKYIGTGTLHVGVLAAEGLKLYSNITVRTTLNSTVEIFVNSTSTETVHVGGIIGECSTSNSDAVTLEFTGAINVKAGGNAYVGGLIAQTTSTVRLINSFADCTVICESKNAYVGGLIGKVATCNLNNCYHDGTVKVTAISDAYVGGLIGENSSTSSIIMYGSNHSGSITVIAGGTAEVAGLVTYDLYRVEKCYAVCDISVNAVGSAYVAGISGGADDGANLYYQGDITVVSNGKYCHVGGLFYDYATVINAYAKGMIRLTVDNNLVGVRCAGISANSLSTEIVENCVSMMAIEMYFKGTKESYDSLFANCGLISARNVGVKSCYAYDDITLNDEKYECQNNDKVNIAERGTISTQDFYVNVLGWKLTDWNFATPGAPTLIITAAV